MKRSASMTANRPARLDIEQMRLITKVARLYYIHGERQAEIAEKMGVSQASVSRSSLLRKNTRLSAPL